MNDHDQIHAGVRRGVQGPRGRCWLKNRAPHPVSDRNTVSGVKFRPLSIRLPQPDLIPGNR